MVGGGEGFTEGDGSGSGEGCFEGVCVGSEVGRKVGAGVGTSSLQVSVSSNFPSSTAEAPSTTSHRSVPMACTSK
jgi:hypothetical protein